jgi:hypothetical protein
MFVLQGEVGMPGHKGSKGDKGDAVSRDPQGGCDAHGRRYGVAYVLWLPQPNLDTKLTGTEGLKILI